MGARVRGDSIFRSAVTGDDGEIDAGYLSLFWVMAAVLGAIPVLLIVALIGVGHDNVAAVLQATGIAIGAACTGLGVSVGAVGAFRAGDKPRAGVATTTTTTTASAPAVPVPVVAPTADVLQAAGRGVEPMPDKIGPEDVGKKPLLGPKPTRRKRGRKA
jgi:hypothetical protein